METTDRYVHHAYTNDAAASGRRVRMEACIQCFRINLSGLPAPDPGELWSARPPGGDE